MASVQVQKDEFALEQMIDRNELSLPYVLDLIEGICRAKAEHLRENWQDETSARTWERKARAIRKATSKCWELILG